MLAVLLGNYDFFIYVSNLSIEKYKSPSDSATAVSLSIEMGNLCFLKILSNKPDFNILDKVNCYTLLMLACEQGNYEIIEFIITKLKEYYPENSKFKHQINYSSNRRNTRNYRAINYLIDNGNLLGLFVFSKYNLDICFNKINETLNNAIQLNKINEITCYIKNIVFYMNHFHIEELMKNSLHDWIKNNIMVNCMEFNKIDMINNYRHKFNNNSILHLCTFKTPIL
jgi:ankyrin repeat protein